MNYHFHHVTLLFNLYTASVVGSLCSINALFHSDWKVLLQMHVVGLPSIYILMLIFTGIPLMRLEYSYVQTIENITLKRWWTGHLFVFRSACHWSLSSPQLIFSRPGIVLGYRLDGHGIGVQFPVGAKVAGSEADHSPPSSAETKNMWIYTSIHLLQDRRLTFYFSTIIVYEVCPKSKCTDFPMYDLGTQHLLDVQRRVDNILACMYIGTYYF
jgi:hypothetical protein